MWLLMRLKQGKEIKLPDDGLRTETCRSSFSVLMCKFYISALVGIVIDSQACILRQTVLCPACGKLL